jgi:hypothetical protein
VRIRLPRVNGVTGAMPPAGHPLTQVNGQNGHAQQP